MGAAFGHLCDWRMYRLIVLTLLSGCAGNYIEFEHTSFPRDGKFPVYNNRPETTSDIVSAGYRHRFDSGIYLDGSLGVQVGDSELEGRDPVGKFKVGWEKR